MWKALCILGLFLTTVALADPPPPIRPLPAPPPQQSNGPSVLSPNVSVIRGSEDFRLDRPPTVWQQIQPDLDRSTGYIIPGPLFQLDQLDLLKDPRFDLNEARRTYELYNTERERQLRIDQRQLDQRRAAQRSEAQQREAAMKLKEYELYLKAGPFDAAGAQAEADRNALQAAKDARDEQLKQAMKDRDESLAKLAPNDPARQQVQNQFESRRQQLEQAYQKERSRILGFDNPQP
jgi:hypothetical protein